MTPNLVWDRRAVSPPEGFTSGGPRPWPPGAAPRPALAPSPPPPRGGGAGGGDGTGGGPRGRRGRRPPRGAPAGGWDGPSRPRRALSPPLRDPPHGGAPRGPARTWGTVGALCRPSSRVPQGDGGRGGRRVLRGSAPLAPGPSRREARRGSVAGPPAGGAGTAAPPLRGTALRDRSRGTHGDLAARPPRRRRANREGAAPWGEGRGVTAAVNMAPGGDGGLVERRSVAGSSPNPPFGTPPPRAPRGPGPMAGETDRLRA